MIIDATKHIRVEQHYYSQISMILIVTEADVILFDTSEQFTTVSFKPMLTESIDNVEIRGDAS